MYRMGRGGINLPKDHYFAAISEPLGIGGGAFMTFPEWIGYRVARSGRIWHLPEIQCGGRKTENALKNHNYKYNFNGHSNILDHAQLRYDTTDTLHDIGRHPELKMEATKTGSGNNCWTVRAGEAVPAATPTFSTMLDADMTLPTLPDIGRHPELKMTATKTGSGKTLEREELAKRFQWLPTHFRPCPTQIWHCRHGPTLGTQNVGQETGSGNNVLSSRRRPMSSHVCSDIPESDMVENVGLTAETT